MLNNELDSLQDIIALMKRFDYTVYIEVSPFLYLYLKQRAQSIKDFYIDATFDMKVYPETFYGCEIFVNSSLKGFEYRLTRKENV